MRRKKCAGTIVILSAGLIAYACASIFNFDLALAVVLTTILNIIGLCLIAFGIADSKTKFVPKRWYRLINYSNEGGTSYATFKYKNACGINKIYTFKNANFEGCCSFTGVFLPGCAPVEGQVYIACEQKGDKKIILKRVKN